MTDSTRLLYGTCREGNRQLGDRTSVGVPCAEDSVVLQSAVAGTAFPLFVATSTVVPGAESCSGKFSRELGLHSLSLVLQTMC